MFAFLREQMIVMLTLATSLVWRKGFQWTYKYHPSVDHFEIWNIASLWILFNIPGLWANDMQIYIFVTYRKLCYKKFVQQIQNVIYFNNSTLTINLMWPTPTSETGGLISKRKSHKTKKQSDSWEHWCNGLNLKYVYLLISLVPNARLTYAKWHRSVAPL